MKYRWYVSIMEYWLVITYECGMFAGEQ